MTRVFELNDEPDAPRKYLTEAIKSGVPSEHGNAFMFIYADSILYAHLVLQPGKNDHPHEVYSIDIAKDILSDDLYDKVRKFVVDNPPGVNFFVVPERELELSDVLEDPQIQKFMNLTIH